MTPPAVDGAVTAPAGSVPFSRVPTASRALILVVVALALVATLAGRWEVSAQNPSARPALVRARVLELAQRLHENLRLVEGDQCVAVCDFDITPPRERLGQPPSVVPRHDLVVGGPDD